MFGALADAFRRDNPDDLIDHETFCDAVKHGRVTVVDVREAAEFKNGSIAGSINMPLSAFDPSALPRDKPVVVYCISGARSAMAQRALRSAGFDDVRNYKPGFGVWRLQGGPVA